MQKYLVLQTFTQADSLTSGEKGQKLQESTVLVSPPTCHYF